MSACLLIQTIYSRSTRTKRRSIHLEKVTIYYVWLACKHWLRSHEAEDKSPSWSGWHRSALSSRARWLLTFGRHESVTMCSARFSSRVCVCMRKGLVKGPAKGRHWILKSLSRLPHIDLFLLPAACTAFKRTLSSRQRELSILKWKPNTWCLFLCHICWTIS